MAKGRAHPRAPRRRRVICATEAYRLGASASAKTDPENKLWTRFHLVPLGPEELMNALLRATDLETAAKKSGIQDLDALRVQLVRQYAFLFDVDETDDVADYWGTVTQALSLLNGQLVGLLLKRSALAGPGTGTAKSVILLYINGGPSHIDTWDPKTGKVAGPNKAIKTSAPGVMISEHMPLIAKHANKLAIVRGMTSKEGNHQRAQFLLRTGYSPNPTVQHPTPAAWLSKRMGEPKSGLPGSVSLGGPSLGAGFFGVQYGPFVVQIPGSCR